MASDHPPKSPRFWWFATAVLAPVLCCIAWQVRGLEINLADLGWRVLGFAGNLVVPSIVWSLFVKYQKKDGAEEKVHRDGFLGLLQDPAVRTFAVFIILPACGWLGWDLRKRTLAKAGPVVNASVQAIFALKDFAKVLASVMLLPLVSMVTAAHQAGDHARILQVVGAGLGVGLVAGLLVQMVAMVFAQQLLGLFEGAQTLIPETPGLARVSFACFAFQVLNDGLMGTLAGLAEYMAIGECLCPIALTGVLGTLVFAYTGSLTWMCGVAATLDLLLFICLFLRVRVAILRVQREKHGQVDSAAAKASFWASLADFAPSKEVLAFMASAASNTGVRNCTLRLQWLLCSMFATRVGNVHGSLFTLYGTVQAYLGGPAGLCGIFTANVAPRLLELRFLNGLVQAARGMVFSLVVGALIWVFIFARGGASTVLWFGGINEKSGERPSNEFGQYLEVMTPFNHWLFILGVVLNEVAAPFDGFLITLKAFRSIGCIYGVDFLLVLLPVLYLTNEAGMQGRCPLPASIAPSGCNSFTSVALPSLAWSSVRLAGNFMAMFVFQCPELERQRDKYRAALSREQALEYMRSRADAPLEETAAHVAEMKRRNGLEREMYRFRVGGPIDTWTKDRGSSGEVMLEHFLEFHKDANGEGKRISEVAAVKLQDDPSLLF